MVVEMRTYKIKPGKRAEFLEVFRSKSFPAHHAIGMRIVGPFYRWRIPTRSFSCGPFPDLASREPMKAQFYEGELWKGELEHVLMPLIKEYRVVLVEDTEDQIRFGS